jgi:hypothetical protein
MWCGFAHFPQYRGQFTTIIVGTRTLILATAHIQEDAFDRAMTVLKTWTTRPDAAFWFAMCGAEGTRK